MKVLVTGASGNVGGYVVKELLDMNEHNIKLVCFLSLMGVENNPVPPHHKIEKYIEKKAYLMPM